MGAFTSSMLPIQEMLHKIEMYIHLEFVSLLYGAYLSLLVHWHVHPDEFFVRHSLWTLFAKSQRGIDIPQHVENLCVVNFPTASNRVLLEPNSTIGLCIQIDRLFTFHLDQTLTIQ